MESLFKYQSRLYNVERNNYVNHRGMKMRWNNKTFPSLNDINGKPGPYGRKGVIRYYHYRSYPILGPEIVETKIFICSFHACTKILSLSWDSTIK